MTATVAGATRLLRTFAHHQHVHMIDALHDGGAERVTRAFLRISNASGRICSARVSPASGRLSGQTVAGVLR